MSTEATKQQSLNYGNLPSSIKYIHVQRQFSYSNKPILGSLVIDGFTGSVNHYVEKPSSYVSTFINCGIYICSLDVFAEIAQVFHSRELNESMQNRDRGYIEWEREILTKLAGTGNLLALPVSITIFFKFLTLTVLWYFKIRRINGGRRLKQLAQQFTRIVVFLICIDEQILSG